MDISIIVPLYNEEDSVTPLYEAIVKSVDRMNVDYEMLFVDDGIKNNTVTITNKLSERDERPQTFRLQRNHEKILTIAADIDNATRKALVTKT